MTRRDQYLASATVIALIWFALSFWLTLMMAGAEDTMPLDLPVPLWLKTTYSIAFPLRYLIPANPFFPRFDHAYGIFVMVVMFINSALWGLVLIFVFQQAAGLVKGKKRDVENAA